MTPTQPTPTNPFVGGGTAEDSSASPKAFHSQAVPSEAPPNRSRNVETLGETPQSAVARPTQDPIEPADIRTTEPQPSTEPKRQEPSEDNTEQTEDSQVRILSALLGAMKDLKIPYSSILLREAILVLNQGIDDDDGPQSLEETLAIAQDNLKEHFKAFVPLLEVGELAELLGEETLEAIRLMEIKRLQSNAVKDVLPPLRAQSKVKEAAPKPNKKQSASGLYLDAFKSKFIT